MTTNPQSLINAYTDLLLAGLRSWDTVPNLVKKDVEDNLKLYVSKQKITQEQYANIVA